MSSFSTQQKKYELFLANPPPPPKIIKNYELFCWPVIEASFCKFSYFSLVQYQGVDYNMLNTIFGFIS